MARILRITFPEKCIGCELCVMEAQKQLNKVGLDGSLIRILRDAKDGNSFNIHLDPQINGLDIKQLVEICPTGVFEIAETIDEELIS